MDYHGNALTMVDSSNQHHLHHQRHPRSFLLLEILHLCLQILGPTNLYDHHKLEASILWDNSNFRTLNHEHSPHERTCKNIRRERFSTSESPLKEKGFLVL